MTRFDQYLTKRANFRKKNKGFINFLPKQDMKVDKYIIICLLLEKLTQKMPNNVEVDKNCFRARLVVRLASEISIICPDGEIFIDRVPI